MGDVPLVPYDWQQADIDKITALISPEVGALVVSAPGAGKTLVAVEVQRRLKPEVTLIIAPPSTHPSWERTLKRQGVATEVRHLIGTAKGRKAYADLTWGKPGTYITSAQWFSRHDWGHIDIDMVVFDEIHQATRYGNVGQRKLVGSGKKKGLWAPIRLALSGTPFRNNFENAWSLTRWVEPKAMPKDYWVWRRSDCAGTWDNFAPQNYRVTGEKKPGTLASRLTCLITHSQREECCSYHPNGFLADLAAPIHVERDLRMTERQGKFYHTMENSLFGHLFSPDENGVVPVVAEIPIVARSMLRFAALGLPAYDMQTEKLFFEEDCESPKLDELVRDLTALDGRRLLVFTHSAQFAEVTHKRLEKAGFRSALWRGGMTPKGRTTILDQFRTDQLDAIVGVISAMGTGTDGLQEAAYNIAWLSVDDDPSNDIQGISRLDRLGQKHRVVMVEYRMLGTYDVGHLPRAVQKQLDLNKSLRTQK